MEVQAAGDTGILNHQRAYDRLVKHIHRPGVALRVLQVGPRDELLAQKLSSTASVITIVEPGLLLNAENGLSDAQFDCIIFSSSIQYFDSIKLIIAAALKHLSLQGQIHIIGSPFYTLNRSSTNAGPYLHDLSQLESFTYKIIHDPSSWINKLVNRNDPYYHIVIKNPYQA